MLAAMPFWFLPDQATFSDVFPAPEPQEDNSMVRERERGREGGKLWWDLPAFQHGQGEWISGLWVVPVVIQHDKIGI
jgi:hypothetical protein